MFTAKKKALPALQHNGDTISLGADPELFIRDGNDIIGSEKVLPKGGIVPVGYGNNSRVIIDGVQAEINPAPATCREVLAGNIIACLAELKRQMAIKGKTLKADFSTSVEISEEKLNELSAESKKLGCAPSENINRIPTRLSLTKIDPLKYRIRGAGGHIHIGMAHIKQHQRVFRDDVKLTVQMLDTIVGNTFVLLDRDPGNIERRKTYGRAGEYRLPKHGLEYRTLSNFWLTAYPLMSLAFGLSRMTIKLMTDNNWKDYYSAFTGAVKHTNINRAINTNNFELAMENFKAIEQSIIEVTQETGYYPLTKNYMPNFHYFIDKIQSNGIKYWFPQDPMEHWTQVGPIYRGFRDFQMQIVAADMKKEADKKEKAA